MLEDIGFQGLNESENIANYTSTNSTYFNMEAVFSDESENFVSPCEPKTHDNVIVKFRTAKDDIKNVFIVIDGLDQKMEIIETDDTFNFWGYTIEKIDKTYFYYFKLIHDDKVYFYNKNGLFEYVDIHYNFRVIPDFITPNWAKSAVMYQIYVDRFYNGDLTNDVVQNEYIYLGKPVHKKQWTDPITDHDPWDFYGGDLQGVIDKVSYLKDLGIECIYFNPLFVSPSNHKYDISDYDNVDPHIGVIIEDHDTALEFEKFNNSYATMYMKRTTSKINLEKSNELLIKLIEIFHANDIKVILDGVFNHCGAFNKWLDTEGFYEKQGYPTGAYKSEDSIYHDYFYWLENKWPNNDNYDGWWGYKNHPKLNFESSKELEEYILNVGKKWVSAPYNADGWRLDVAADLGSSSEYNHSFWQKFRKVVKEANSEAIIIAEHYGDKDPWLLGNEWDTVMNYDAFMEPITWFLTGMEKHSEDFKPEFLCNSHDFVNRMKYHMASFSIQSLNTAMNQLSNHDHSRFLTRTNQRVGRLSTHGKECADTGVNFSVMYIAIVMQMTWVGSPTLYYGDEAGLTGFTDPDNRRPYPWGSENKELIDFYRTCIKIHKENYALKHGSLAMLHLEHGIISYGRFTKDNKICVIVNNNPEPRKIVIPIWKIGTKANSQIEVLVRSKIDSYNTYNNVYNIVNGFLEITVNRLSSVILRER